MDIEILFKAKRIDNGEWEEGYYCKYGYVGKEKHYIIPIYASDLYAFEIDPNTLCQYTGLTNCNGNKIFDGDILVLVKGATHPIKVYWDGLGWKFLRNGKKIEDAFECNTIGHIRLCEVIGNIFDNPELLGGADNG